MNQFSQEEKDILQSFEEGEWISQGTAERLEQLQLYAKNRDDQQITLTLPTQDLKSIETHLNPEEKELLESVENVSQEIKGYQTYANHQINHQKIEVTLSVEDSQKIQKLSLQLGQSIANLSQDILHKYLQGELIEREP